ncbi:MAG: cyclic lactone autoinducer peptide [Butyrivibrio sp.]|nr:cyclic lactone autoinducer peptide [Butyrivibrio sp.]
MKITETMKEAAMKVGMLMARVDINTTCLWINYQAKEPSGIRQMRKKKECQ